MSVKGNLARGRQKTLESGENIKTVNGKDILGGGDLKIGKWKLIGGLETETAGTELRLKPVDDDFLSKYTKFRLIAEFELEDSSLTSINPEIGLYLNEYVTNGKLFLPYSGGNGQVAKPKKQDGTYLSKFTVVFDMEKVTDSVMTITLTTQGSTTYYAYPPPVVAATNSFIDLMPAGCSIYFRHYTGSTHIFSAESTLNLYAWED